MKTCNKYFKNRQEFVAIIINSDDGRELMRIYQTGLTEISLMTQFQPSTFPDFTNMLETVTISSLEELHNISGVPLGFYIFKTSKTNFDRSLSEIIELLKKYYNQLHSNISIDAKGRFQEIYSV